MTHDHLLNYRVDLPSRLANAEWTKTKKYDPPHEYIMSHFKPEYMDLWFDFRASCAEHGERRPFYKSVFTYLDLEDGFSYWVMPAWIQANWERRFDPNDSYVLNRQKTTVAKSGPWNGS